MLCTRGVVATLSLGLFLAAVGDAEAKVPGKMKGKIFFTTERIKDVAPDALVGLFSKRKPSIELHRTKDKHWKVTLVAFFRKASAHGPITVWLYDKADKASLRAKEPVHVMSLNNSEPKKVFVHDLDIDPGYGFNKKHSYLIFVGQIIGKRHRHYARGEVSLLE